MTRTQLRYANEADATALIDFWSRSAEDSHRPPDSTDAIRALIARDSAALILAVDGAEIVGSVIAGWDGWRCHLYRLAVAPDRRRQGIGALLVKAAELRFQQLGATRADAMVLADNEAGQALWQARGYTLQPEWRRWVRPL